MRQKEFTFGTLTILFFCVLAGCQSASVTGRDPLLGKTRLDPPATSARSVYVERQSVSDSGLVPGGKQDFSSSVGAQASAQTYTARYLSMDQKTDPQTETVPKSSETSGNSNASHLRWKSVHSESERSEASAPAAPSGEFTLEPASPAEVAKYQFYYDFSVFPPRKVMLNENPYTAGTSASNASSFQSDSVREVPQLEQPSERPERSAPRYVQTGNLQANYFDPYAPHRQYDRRRQALSRDFERDFAEIQPRAQLAGKSTPAAGQAPQTMPTQGTAPELPASEIADSGNVSAAGQANSAGGWKVVSRIQPSESGKSSPREESPLLAETQPEKAETSPAVGASAALPKEPKNTSKAPAAAPRPVRDNSLNLLDLPEP